MLGQVQAQVQELGSLAPWTLLQNLLEPRATVLEISLSGTGTQRGPVQAFQSTVPAETSPPSSPAR